jgi:hypothetical protein
MMYFINGIIRENLLISYKFIEIIGVLYVC